VVEWHIPSRWQFVAQSLCLCDVPARTSCCGKRPLEMATMKECQELMQPQQRLYKTHNEINTVNTVYTQDKVKRLGQQSGSYNKTSNWHFKN